MADATTGAAETPLQDRLRRIPRDAIYQWVTPEADRELWQLSSNSAPIGRLAHEAADRLDSAALTPRHEAPAEGADDDGRLFAEAPLGTAALYRDLENGIRPILATREEAPAHEFVQSFSTAREGGCKVCGRDEEAHREAPAEAGECKVWVVYGDDHDYDVMSQWLVGVYETEAEAEAAAEADQKRYVLEGGSKGRPGYDISSTSLTLRAQPPARSGKVTWHSSGEDEGPDVGLQLDLGHGRSLWLGEGQKPNGWQFSLVQGDDIIPVADVIDHEQARDLFDLIASAVQPPAREDAQPVAWRAKLGRHDSWVHVTYDPTGQSGWHSAQPLYTHPAPDALRVAVEALEPFARLELPKKPVGNAGAWSLLHSDIRRAKEALAALQAEQKGGA